MITFANPGIIDPCMWETFGVSVKNTDTAIGQFGTGLKYAIAVMLREKRQLRIESGGNTYDFSTRPVIMRDQPFDRVFCNDKELPFTTHLGSGWELWQAYRELYSNCSDEGGGLGGVGDTVIFAELNDIVHSSVFLTPGELVISSDNCDVYRGSANYLYCKGVRVHDLATPSKYTYDIKDIELTEDRTIKSGADIQLELCTVIAQSENIGFTTDILKQSKTFFEDSLNFIYSSTPSKQAIDVGLKHKKDASFNNTSLMSKLSCYFEPEAFIDLAMDDRQQRIVAKASDFCKTIGYEIKYPIVLNNNLGEGVLAIADRNTETIRLSERVLTQGVKQVIATLIEENIHLELKLADLTYDMQTYLFDQIVTMGERLTGEIL